MRFCINEFDDEGGNSENAAEDETGGNEDDEEFLSLSPHDYHVKSDDTCYKNNDIAEKVEQGACMLYLSGFQLPLIN